MRRQAYTWASEDQGGQGDVHTCRTDLLLHPRIHTVGMCLPRNGRLKRPCVSHSMAERLFAPPGNHSDAAW